MLPQQDLLVGLAQIALTLTGFAALVSVFRKAEDGWKPDELIGLYIILEFSIGSTFFAMFPILVSYLTGTQVGVWKTSAFIHVLFAIGWIAVMIARIIRIRRRYGTWGINPLIALLITLFPLPLLLIEIANALWLDSFAIYFLHTLYLMLVSGTQFIIFVYNYAADRQEKHEENREPILPDL